MGLLDRRERSSYASFLVGNLAQQSQDTCAARLDRLTPLLDRINGILQGLYRSVSLFSSVERALPNLGQSAQIDQFLLQAHGLLSKFSSQDG